MKPKIEELIGKQLHRSATLSVADAGKRTVELAFSSDKPVEQWPGVLEVLSHDSGACDLSRLNDGANILFNHDPDSPLGVVEEARIDKDRVGRALVRFGNSPEAVAKWQDVQDGILTKVSVGYRILELKLTEEREGGPDVYTVTKWEPYEISIVTIPADMSVGVGRSMSHQPTQSTQKPMNTEPKNEVEQKPTPTISIEQERAAIRKEENDRVRSITALGKKFGLEKEATDLLTEGASIDQAREAIYEALEKRNTKVTDANKPVGLSEREAKDFSFVKALRVLAHPTDHKFREEAAFELEVCEAAAKNMSHRSVSGLLVPIDVLRVVGQRAASGNVISEKSGTGYTGTGANAIQTSLLADSFIGMLKNHATIMNLATDLSGLVGNVDIPKQSGQIGGYWVGEDDSAPTDSLGFGLVSLRPKTVAAKAIITRQMLKQPSLGVESLVRTDLSRGIGLAIDIAAYYGAGTGNAPTGLSHVAGIGSVNLAAAGAPTFAELVQCETAMASANADIGRISWVINPAQRGYAKTTRRLATATDSATLWEPGNTLNGYQVQVTNQITAGDLFFGNFADFLIGLWGGLELTVDPYSGSDKGRLQIVGFQDVDFAVRHPESFVMATHTA
ncbi:MAG: phage major capsid protein [Verrucomicrobium sp.]|nr:phage major capsid protein [Verrucomicrobium sp.]